MQEGYETHCGRVFVSKCRRICSRVDPRGSLPVHPKSISYCVDLEGRISTKAVSSCGLEMSARPGSAPGVFGVGPGCLFEAVGVVSTPSCFLDGLANDDPVVAVRDGVLRGRAGKGIGGSIYGSSWQSPFHGTVDGLILYFKNYRSFGPLRDSSIGTL